ncbi:hypothetical protein ABPG74_006744 [Tetrahymena malaccensis]
MNNEQLFKQNIDQAQSQYYTTKQTQDSLTNQSQVNNDNSFCFNYLLDETSNAEVEDFQNSSPQKYINPTEQDNIFQLNEENNHPINDEQFNQYEIDDFLNSFNGREEYINYQQQDQYQQFDQEEQPDVYQFLNLQEEESQNQYVKLDTLQQDKNSIIDTNSTTGTVNKSNLPKQRRDVKDDKFIQIIQNLTQLDLEIEDLRQFKNEIKKNTIRTILQKNNKNINQVRLQQYFNEKLDDKQVCQIYENINDIYYQLFPKCDDRRVDILVAFVQLYNENRTKFNYKNVKYLFQDASSNQDEINEQISIVKRKIEGSREYILSLIKCAQQIFKQFFNQFLEYQLIPYLYSEYKMNTYPNERYPSPQYKHLDIHITLYCVEILFIQNMK